LATIDIFFSLTLLIFRLGIENVGLTIQSASILCACGMPDLGGRDWGEGGMFIIVAPVRNLEDVA